MNQEQQRIEDAKMLGKMAAQIEDMHKCLFGNGKPGLNDRFTIVENNQRVCIKERQSRQGLDVGKKNNLIAIYAVIVAAIALIVTVLK